jgi:hypothetical protein
MQNACLAPCSMAMSSEKTNTPEIFHKIFNLRDVNKCKHTDNEIACLYISLIHSAGVHNAVCPAHTHTHTHTYTHTHTHTHTHTEHYLRLYFILFYVIFSFYDSSNNSIYVAKNDKSIGE